MNHIDNPFTPVAGVEPPVLSGRNELLREFEVELGRTIKGRPGQSLVPLGLRGVGKTTLLKRFMRIADQRGCSIAYVEAPASGSLRQNLAAQLGIVGTEDSGILQDDMNELFVLAAKTARDRGTCIVIAIDEIQYLRKDELAAIIGALHQIAQRDLPLIFVGTGLPSTPMLAGNAKPYAERMFKFPRIGSLSASDTRAAIEDPAESVGVVFSVEALDVIIDVTKGYPYFIQQWAFETWNAATISPIPRETVDTIKPRVEEKLDREFFSFGLARLTPNEKRYLGAMSALGAGPHQSDDVASHLGLSIARVSPIRSALIKKRIIYSPRYGDTAFTAPLFDEFVRRVLLEESLPQRRSRRTESRRLHQ